MRVVIVGLGTQGYKRKYIAGSQCIATVDPINGDADFKHLSHVPSTEYDAVLLCVPDSEKVALIHICISKKKHVLVEKPLWGNTEVELRNLEALSNKEGVLIYTAYNHRFEPSFKKMKTLIESGQLGKLYNCRIFYGNGTAKLVRNSAWRDKGTGVLFDLGSHLLDTTRYWFGDITGKLDLISINRFENQSPDHAVLVFQDNKPRIELEMTLLSWKNHFSCDIFAEYGSAHIKSLCKWGNAEFSIRSRVFPSGPPIEENYKFEDDDPTWLLEFEHFKSQGLNGFMTNFSKDLWIYRELQEIEKRI
ncbi:Gfo/Idh/MocA family oxidoreductase [Rhodospirillaceae bacterium]|nr:Gfo/Idh/MocA family oxidoreductase [Rhodospirillaceae bacterium]|tara:strand:+ start:681 stop:1595 length:915 start_codon:yes stop_codon:yes gene_type:complete